MVRKKRKVQLKAKKANQPISPLKEIMTGILRVHPRGFGFVIPDHPTDCPQDVFIPKQLTDGAVDGDHVEVLINPHSNSDKGPEGKVLNILKRGRSHLAGTIRETDAEGNFLATVPILGLDKKVIVKPQETPLKIGDRVTLRVLEWGEEKEEALCELSHKIGHISDPSCDVAAAAEEFDLLTTFPSEAVLEAKAYGTKVSKKEMDKRKDLTKLTCITIDPDTAKDFDDALSLEEKKGNYHLGVHIADVAHYVKKDSALDIEALKRCNSTYFPGQCLPMLPEELSNHLCSLKPDVIRLSVSVLMTFDKEGNLLNYEIHRGYIKSAKRFTYGEAFEIIEGRAKSPHEKTLQKMVALCHLLKKKRSLRGSIDFALADNVIEVDKQGVPLGLKTVEYDISHQLVEEFMLKANEVVAKHLSDAGKMLVYRIHEAPSTENMQDFFSLARSLGFHLPHNPEQQDLQKLFNEAKSTPYGQQLAVGFIRSMKLATYSPENVGHYGLALEHYCHFTSPIRRYPDLVIQRLLFQEEGKVNLEQTALKCSEQERVSFRAESSVKLLKKLRLLKQHLQEDPNKKYIGIITRIKPFGVVFEVPELMLEGFLHISELEDDYFLYDQKQGVLRGKTSGKIHAVGESLQLKACSVDLILLESSWELTTRRRKRR